MSDQQRDIHGNAVNWVATGRRVVAVDGHLRAELRRDGWAIWPAARPHDDCAACEDRLAHTGCPVLRTPHDPNAKEKP